MKRWLSLFVAVVLCLSMVAFADVASLEVPSRGADDFYMIPTDSDDDDDHSDDSNNNDNTNSNNEAAAVSQSSDQTAAVALQTSLIAAIQAATTPEAKTEAVAAALGVAADQLTAIVGSAAITVTEAKVVPFTGVSVGNNTLVFDTKYTPGSQVALVLTINGQPVVVSAQVDADGNPVLELTPELAQMINGQDVLIAVVSAAA